MKFTIFDPANRSQAADAAEDKGRNPSRAPTIGDVIAARMNRRDLMKGALGYTAIAATVSPMALAARPARAEAANGFAFEEIEAGVGTDHLVAPGYDAKVLLRWGDPVLADAPAFDPANQTADAQSKQFGYNNDFVGVVPLPDAPDDANRVLLVVNHEYTNEELMFPDLGVPDGDAAFAGTTPELIEIEMAAHGGTIVEIARGADGWKPVTDSRYNRRITASTPMRISGPAAGAERMKTSADPTGAEVLGTLNNCAGGVTPWGTWLMAEENFNGYFRGDDTAASEQEGLTDDPAKILNARYGIPGNWYAWGREHARFDIAKEPNEPNRFGWIVEVDPSDPSSTPVKRTALGRMKHEGGETIVNADGRIVVFMGDDERFDYIYRFVSDEPWDEANPDPDILDKGTLSVAR
ncbi:MAG TPA: alkaline phosphatase PhoX, partial [Thermohalobaculum sp.]|nr:alkaline phosphatase PhoX [Thermohalobaculum sp.]